MTNSSSSSETSHAHLLKHRYRARTRIYGFGALRIAQVQLGTEPITGESLKGTKAALLKAKIEVQTNEIEVGQLKPNPKNTLRDIYVIGNCSREPRG